MARNHTTERSTDKISKPYDGFPLSIHAPTGRFYKKIHGKRYYFGRIADGWQAALARYESQRDDLFAGRTPRPPAEGLRLGDLLNRYRSAKLRQRDAGEISARCYLDYVRACDEVNRFFGRDRLVTDLLADDFGQLRADLARRLGPVGLWNAIRRVRMIFAWAYNNGLIDRPIRYGDQFKRPSARVLRLHKANKGPRVYEDPAVIRKMIRMAGVNLKAAVLLALNAGLGNTDLALLPKAAVDLDKGWLSYARHKTGIDRRCPLWSETIEALKDVLAHRKAPKDPAHEGLVFVNKFEEPYVRGTGTDGLGQEFRKLQKKIRDDHDFYSLRHSFESVAMARTGDLGIIKAMMGHAPDERDMTTTYDHSMQMEQFRADLDARRVRAARAVHDWLYKDADKDEVADEKVDR